MDAFTLIGLFIAIASYLFITQFHFKKRLNIKSKWRGMISQDRNRYILAIEFVICFLIFASMMSLAEKTSNQTNLGLILTTPMFALFFLLGITRGFEEWLLHREEKAYYYEWLGSILILVTFLIIFIGQQA